MNLTMVPYRHGKSMSPTQWKKIDELLDTALDLPPERHAAFLDEACAGDEELRRELVSLLAAHEKAGSFIETTPGHGLSTLFAERGLAQSQTQAQTLVGRTLGHYEVVALIGSGGMGEVYKARDPRLDRNVAIKVLPQHLSSHPEAMNRFEREAKAVAALSHPNILAIHDFGHEGGMAYAVMELLEGESLRQRMSHSVLNWRETVKISASVSEGLAAAHSKGIIHRDIKPENIFLTTDGLVKILDFGIARVKKTVVSHAETLISQGLSETKPGTLMGTIGYMSPEQVRGDSADAPSDIFSLGCVMLEMLTGERPFVRKSAAETMAAILRDDPPSLEATEIPPELERIVQRCMEKSPEERFQSARDLSFDLRSLLTSASGTYRAVSGAMPALTNLTPQVQSTWRMPVVLTIAIIAGLALAGIITWQAFRQPDPSQNSVAILPFANNSGDSATDYLSEGIPESVTISLAQVPELRVMGWSTVKFKTQKQENNDPQKIGRDLNVYAVVLGKVAQHGDALVVTVEMLDVGNGAQLWGDRFDLKLADTQNIQLEIARSVSEKLLAKSSFDQAQQLNNGYRANPEAHQLYLQGRYHLNKRDSEWDKELTAAIDSFKKAVEKDPQYALAHAGLANAYVLLEETSANTIAAANKALQLDPKLVEPKAAIAFAQAQYDWKWQEAETGFLQAIAQNPRYATAHHWYAEFLTIQGRFDEAIREIKEAGKLEPFSTPISADIGIYHFFARRYDEAIAQLRKTLQLDPNSSKARGFLNASYEQNKNYDEAVNTYLDGMRKQGKAPEEIEAYQKAYAQKGMPAYWRKKLLALKPALASGDKSALIRAAYLHSALGEKNQAIEMLEAAYKKRYYALWYLNVDPRYDNVRNDPRFTDLLKRVGF